MIEVHLAVVFELLKILI